MLLFDFSIHIKLPEFIVMIVIDLWQTRMYD
jgi:hypothetical protein